MKNPLTIVLSTLVGFPFLIMVSLVLQSHFVSYTNNVQPNTNNRQPIGTIQQFVTNTRMEEGTLQETTHNSWEFNEISNTVTIVNAATGIIETYLIHDQEDLIGMNHGKSTVYNCTDASESIEYQFVVRANEIVMWIDKYTINGVYVEFNIAARR